MPLSDSQKAALNRLQSFYEGDNPYNSVSNPGGFRQGGHLYNFVPALKDLASVITGCAALAVEVATNSAQSPKAVRVDGDQTYTDAEKAQGQKNLGIAATLAAAVSKLGDTMTGVLRIFVTDAALELMQNGGSFDKKKWRLMNYNVDGRLYFQDYSGDTYVNNPWHFGRDGGATSLQMGDLNTRIEARALAYAAQRLALTGGTLTGALLVQNGDIAISKSYPSIQMTIPNGTKRGWQFRDEDTSVQWADYGTGNPEIRISDGGIVYTRQFGDLSTRIETRGAAYRDAAQAFATNADLAKVSKSGDTMTGPLNLSNLYTSGASSGLTMYSRNATADFQAYNNADAFRVYYNQGSIDVARIDKTGALYLAQFGDLNTRIEARGLAYQQQAINLSVQKTGDTMTGDLVISKSNPVMRFFWGGVLSAGFQVGSDGRLLYKNFDNSETYFSVGTGGDISTKQFGDLNSRIESRAQAFADDRANTRFSSARYVFVGDYDIAGNYNGGMVEPYAPSVCTGRSSITSGDGNDIILRAMRFRRPQFYTNAGGWLDVGYA